MVAVVVAELQIAVLRDDHGGRTEYFLEKEGYTLRWLNSHQEVLQCIAQDTKHLINHLFLEIMP